MDLTMQDKVALVTGGSRGIGAAIATAYAEAGAKVVITARKAEALQAAAEAIDGDVLGLPAHAGDPDAARRVVEQTLQTYGRLDVLVNNAATNPHMGRLIDVDLPRFDKTFEVNVRGALAWIQAAWTAWMSEHGGSVLNIASVEGLVQGGPLAVYGLTKTALVSLTKRLALELGPGVRVNALAPGLVKTDFARALWEPAGAEAAYRWPLQRVGLPEDIAHAALFLASEQADWVTGEIFSVDGGAALNFASVAEEE